MSTPESTAAAEDMRVFQSRFADPSPSDLSWGEVRRLRAKVRQLDALQATVNRFLLGALTLGDLIAAARQSEARIGGA